MKLINSIIELTILYNNHIKILKLVFEIKHAGKQAQIAQTCRKFNSSIKIMVPGYDDNLSDDIALLKTSSVCFVFNFQASYIQFFSLYTDQLLSSREFRGMIRIGLV